MQQMVFIPHAGYGAWPTTHAMDLCCVTFAFSEAYETVGNALHEFSDLQQKV